ncbi:Envelope glycoprotein like [Actinidia chinensis var. chinensis]|uniref:Envelope glycoprotein like n=1 Tax=Actinidia chinensis var. chinensis TaxID=1590841 RepID=A0A2R6QTF2_ACTCC|nr:Envelope glycoprotein like [Actinidia chinensis var. chinensis]
MEKDDNGRHVFPLTSLQIGDLQSYLSHLSLFLAPQSKKFYVLVDNRPWLKDLYPRSAHLWQLMVTKSRLSPFANTKARKERKEAGELQTSPKSSTSKSKKFKRWFSVIDATKLSRKRALLPVNKLKKSLILNSKLHGTLYGFIVFEVAWPDVRGINYLNELQTDTSLAIEAKFMKRWEFDSIEQAAKCITSWFSGINQEQLLLKDYLDSVIGDVFYDARENFSQANGFDNDENFCNNDVSTEDQYPCCLDSTYNTSSGSSSPHTPPDGPCKRRKVMKFTSTAFAVDIYPEETHGDEVVDSPLHSETSYASDCEDAVEATQYKDVLILFRFNDRDLPFELKDIIMSDLRLLTLLESGLPSWVIFLQSYPGFCHLYRPWMCPLARTLYVMISFVTVLIGFYDLYKNVPLLKVTASRLCGPLFDWIETWDMVSRIKYLGTMLFLHNCEKAVKWLLMISRTFKSFISVLTQPMAGPLMEFLDFILPFWNMCIELLESLWSVTWIVIGSSFSLLENLVEIVLLPMWFILSTIWTIAMSIFWILWEILYAPFRLVVGLAGFLTFMYACIYDFLQDIWLFVSSIIRLASNADATVSAYEVSIWRSLWNDLFSQIFRALRSILNGVVAFFAACNRHRLSIYNHAVKLIQRLAQPTRRSRPGDSKHRGQTCGSQNLSRTGPHKLKPQKKRS